MELVQVATCAGPKFVQVNPYELQLVQAVCTSCNLYKLFVQVATCIDFLYKLQLVQNLNLYIKYIYNLKKNQLSLIFS